MVNLAIKDCDFIQVKESNKDKLIEFIGNEDCIMEVENPIGNGNMFYCKFIDYSGKEQIASKYDILIRVNGNIYRFLCKDFNTLSH